MMKIHVQPTTIRTNQLLRGHCGCDRIVAVLCGILFLIADIKMGFSLVSNIKYTFKTKLIVINVNSVGTCVANWACSMLLAFDQKSNITDMGFCPGYTPQVFRFPDTYPRLGISAFCSS
jgi:hypothetical protein